MHRLGGIELKVRITIFQNGEIKSQKEFTIPRFSLNSLHAQAKKMYDKKQGADFKIEEI